MSFPLRFLAVVALLVPHSALAAQDDLQDQTEDSAEPVMELVRVTGYHIKRVDSAGPAPVVTFDGDALQEAGINTLAEVARYLPLNFPLQGGIWEAGAAAFDLRGIGTSATLTLINGLRIAPYGQSREPFVDVNSIPVSAIERIEILKDGASAIYGADAIAGVVNIILKSRYEGIEASVGYGGTENGDGNEILADFLAGTEGEHGNILFSLSYFDREAVPPGSRDWYRDSDFTSKGGPNKRSPWGSPGSLFRYDSFMIEADPECGTDPMISSVDIDPWWGDSYCVFNWRQFQELTPSQQRIGATLSGQYAFRPGLRFFGDLFYSKTEGTRQQAPAPVPGSPALPTWFGVPYVPAGHPDNPFGTDGELLFRMLDLGQRQYINNADSWRLVLGLEGRWGEWDWRASLLNSESDVDTDFLNFARSTRIQQALLGQGGDNGDLWYNPFGYRPENDPELLEWLKQDAESSSSTRESSADLQFDRFFGQLPGGPIGVALGLQYREQELNQWVDEHLASGDLAGGIAQVPVSADRGIFSVYTEFSLPLHETLEAQVALRYEDYSDFGSTSNPKIALRWQPADWIMLRGSWSTSFLAPSFYDLYEPPLEILWELVDTVRCEYTGLPQDCDDIYVRGTISGNPDLGPEEGASWFAGLVWDPHFLPGFEFQLDFWKFVHEDRIWTLSPQLVLNTGSDVGITRAPTEPDGTPGVITFVRAMPYNLEEFQTRGLDTTWLYAWETERAGNFKASLMHTYIDEYLWSISTEGDSGFNYAGHMAFNPVPKHRFNLNFTWRTGPHNAAANVLYTGGFEHYQGKWVDGVETDEPWNISSYTTLDLQYAYTFKRLKGATFRIGCVNCSDEPPPFMFNYLAPYADLRGRFYYFRWQQLFH